MENKKKHDNRIQILLAFAAIYIIWGTTYLAIKIGIRDFPSFIMASIRYFLAGSILLGYCLLKKGKMCGVQIIASDQGPGIADIAQVMLDGYSSRKGMGIGLPGTKRLMDEFDIRSTVGSGTTVTMKKWNQ